MEESKKRYLFLADLLTSSSNQKLLIFLLLGLILIGFGVFLFKSGLFESQNQIEIINKNEELKDENITVEIAGAVEKPGVYKLKVGDRIDDLLISAGGINASADREWVGKNINRAAKLADGQKLYIPSQSEVETAKKSEYNKIDQAILGVSGSGLVNINTASQKELESLNGIGPVYAQKIIEQRPYSSLEELVSKKIIPQKTYDKIKSNISY